MLASGPALLTALALLQADAQFVAGMRLESRAGQAPSVLSTATTQGQTPQFQVMLAATPTLGLRLLDDISSFAVSSSTRVFWRPEPFPDRRPLFLEAVEINHAIRPSKRTVWQYNLRTSYGEEDYLFLSGAMPTQPTLPRQLTVLSLAGSTTATWKTSRRGMLVFQMNAQHRRSTDSQSTIGSTATVTFPPQTTAMAAPGIRYQVSRRTLIEVSSPIGDTDVRGVAIPAGKASALIDPTIPQVGTPNGGQAIGQTAHLNFFSVQPQLALSHELTRDDHLRIQAGLIYATTLVGPKVSPLHPLLQVDWDSVLSRARSGPVWRGTLSTGTQWYADPVLGVAVSRGFLQARINAEVSRAWSAGVRVAFATDFTNVQKELPNQSSTAGSFPLDETVLSIDVPLRYRVSSRLSAEFGGSFVERGPYLDSNFGWRRNSRELWLFLNLNAITEAQRGTKPRS